MFYNTATNVALTYLLFVTQSTYLLTRLLEFKRMLVAAILYLNTLNLAVIHLRSYTFSILKIR